MCMHKYHISRAARLAQSVEHQTFNLRAKGSSPLSGDLFSRTDYFFVSAVLFLE